MKSCPKCGYTLSEQDKLCPNCGAEVSPVAAEPELVEKLSFEAIIISERGFTFRIKNSGTAPFTVAGVTFYEQPTQIVAITSGRGPDKDGVVTFLPGDIGEVTFQPTFTGISGLAYPAALFTGSGKKYETSVGHP